MTHTDTANALFQACDATDEKVQRALNEASCAHIKLREALIAGDVVEACAKGMAFATKLQELFHQTVRLAALLDAAGAAHARKEIA